MGMKSTTRAVLAFGSYAFVRIARAEEPPTPSDTPTKDESTEVNSEAPNETTTEKKKALADDASLDEQRRTNIATTEAKSETTTVAKGRVENDTSTDTKSQAEREAERAAEREAQHYRVSLALSFPNSGGPGDLIPTGYAGFETRIHGPVWLIAGASGGFGYVDSSNWSWEIGPRAGLRVEVPVSDFVSVGGFGILSAHYRRANALYISVDEEGHRIPGGGINRLEDVRLGARLGASIHFRTSSLFGIRLDLTMLAAWYELYWGVEPGVDIERGQIQLMAEPGVATTFSF